MFFISSTHFSNLTFAGTSLLCQIQQPSFHVPGKRLSTSPSPQCLLPSSTRLPNQFPLPYIASSCPPCLLPFPSPFSCAGKIDPLSTHHHPPPTPCYRNIRSASSARHIILRLEMWSRLTEYCGRRKGALRRGEKCCSCMGVAHYVLA